MIEDLVVLVMFLFSHFYRLTFLVKSLREEMYIEVKTFCSVMFLFKADLCYILRLKNYSPAMVVNMSLLCAVY